MINVDNEQLNNIDNALEEKRAGGGEYQTPPSTTIMTNAEWSRFTKSDVVNFLVRYGLQKIVVEDGAGKKATVKITSKGEYNTQVTLSENL